MGLRKLKDRADHLTHKVAAQDALLNTVLTTVPVVTLEMDGAVRRMNAAAAALFYGVYGPNEDTESYRLLGSGEFGLSTERMAWYRRHYLSGPAGDAHDPRHAPLLADLSGLPPLFVTAAGLDPLRDDSTALAQRLARTNTPFEFKLYEGVVHGFMQMGSMLPEARTAFSDAAAFLAKNG